ncbi:asparaginase [Zwartia vadi]|uniref:asparaginase n=1 Tax=Zwartia vadi TaxID=3058168 RepID=UPI0025B4FCAC|nr:asparaginase [Zwartia vadi]MDN3986757.1 asparaginase [Zwartia vadi]
MLNSSLPTIAVISTGGTLTTISANGELDLYEYTATGKRLNADEMLQKFPQAKTVANIVPIQFDTLPSTAVSFPHWKKLVLTIEKFLRETKGPCGVVILHGTATIEETAYALSLTLRTDVPVVITGAQRPASALSSDAGLNIYNAVRVAASPQARGMGVLVCLNDEIQAAREVTKSSNSRLQTFRSPDFGALGHADGDRVVFYRKSLRRHNPDVEFEIRDLDALPRVEISYHYAGSDGLATRAFIQAGAQGIVGAAFAPGLLSPEENIAMKEAVAAGVKVVISSRAGSGRTFGPSKIVDAGYIRADNLNPQKARILLALALTKTKDSAEIQRMFEQY